MEQTPQTDAAPRPDPIRIAQEALADSPHYVRHIMETLACCVGDLRSGAQAAGMEGLARAMEDLDQFVQLAGRIAHEARIAPDGVNHDFQRQIHDCVAQMEGAMVRQDIEELSAGIEARLIPLLPDWIPVALELQRGLDQRQETAHV